jgi:hypothetical protein
LLGHLTRLAKWTRGQHEYVVLYHRGNKDICRDLGNNVQWVECPEYTSHWIMRLLWERIFLSVTVSKLNVDMYFTPAGIAVHDLLIPQVVFCTESMVPCRRSERSGVDRIKVILQKREYRRAMRNAALMVSILSICVRHIGRTLVLKRKCQWLFTRQ